MADFQTATEDLMDMVSRPLSELTVFNAAKRELNNAVRWLQRNHAYRFTERLTRFTYPASTLTIKLDSVCEGTLRDINSFQLLGTADANGGQILEYKTYNQIQASRRKFQRETANGSAAQEVQFVCDTIGNETYTSLVHKYFFFRMGEDLGLYPTPTADVEILMNAHIWLPEMTLDADTNFFLTYGYDVVQMVALKKMGIYLKEDNRFGMTQEEINAEVSTLIAWDSQVAESPLTQLT